MMSRVRSKRFWSPFGEKWASHQAPTRVLSKCMSQTRPRKHDRRVCAALSVAFRSKEHGWALGAMSIPPQMETGSASNGRATSRLQPAEQGSSARKADSMEEHDLAFFWVKEIKTKKEKRMSRPLAGAPRGRKTNGTSGGLLSGSRARRPSGQRAAAHLWVEIALFVLLRGHLAW